MVCVGSVCGEVRCVGKRGRGGGGVCGVGQEVREGGGVVRCEGSGVSVNVPVMIHPVPNLPPPLTHYPYPCLPNATGMQRKEKSDEKDRKIYKREERAAEEMKDIDKRQTPNLSRTN